jgi:hypothetical protein
MDDPELEVKPEEPKQICANCERKMSRKGNFCPHCGQRHFDGRIRMRDLLSKFLHSLTHLDNKFIHMVWHLLIPAKVSLEYFKGKIRKYPHPLQFFFVVMFFFLLVLGKKYDGKSMSIYNNGGSYNIGSKSVNVDDNVKQTTVSSESLFDALKKYVVGQEFKSAYDSLPVNLRTPAVRKALDTAVYIVNGPLDKALKIMADEGDSSGVHFLDSIPLHMMSMTVKVGIRDMVNLDPSEIIQKYKITKWEDRLLIKQGIKSVRNPQGLMHTYVGSLTWTILALVAIMSFVLRLLYWKQHRYYVEHFIFLLHVHSGGLLAITLLMLIRWLTHFSGKIWLAVFLGLALFLLAGMKRYYREGYLKTFFKWLVFCFFYMLGFLLLFLAGLLVVFAVY